MKRPTRQGLCSERRGHFHTVAHDSHNIVDLGISDDDTCQAVNRVIENKGDLAVACGDLCEKLPLPVAGLISDKDRFESPDSMLN